MLPIVWGRARTVNGKKFTARSVKVAKEKKGKEVKVVFIRLMRDDQVKFRICMGA